MRTTDRPNPHPHRPKTTICTILFAVMLLLTIGTESAIKNGLPESNGYMQMGIFLLLAVGFIVAAAVEWEYLPEQEEDHGK